MSQQLPRVPSSAVFFTAKKSVNEPPASVEVLRKMNCFSDLKDNNERIEMFLKLLDELYQSNNIEMQQ